MMVEDFLELGTTVVVDIVLFIHFSALLSLHFSHFSMLEYMEFVISS